MLECKNHLGILLKYRFWFSESWMESQILPFQQAFGWCFWGERGGGSPKGHTQVRGVQDCRWHLGTDWTLGGKTCISGNWESYTKRLGLSAVPRDCGLSPFAVPQYSVSVVWARGIQNSFRKCLITDYQIVCIYLSINYMRILLWLAEAGHTCFEWQYGTVRITMQAETLQSDFNKQCENLQLYCDL